jgi:predicted PurR-regulated permease PerM
VSWPLLVALAASGAVGGVIGFFVGFIVLAATVKISQDKKEAGNE